MSDAQADSKALDKVRLSFRRKPRQCMHMLAENTGYSYAALRRMLTVLVNAGEIRRIEGVNKEDKVYMLANVEMAFDPTESRMQELFGLDEQTARNRVRMIKRMKSNLIGEWHPVLDILIRDYERGLQAVEIARDPSLLDDEQPLTRQKVAQSAGDIAFFEKTF